MNIAVKEVQMKKIEGEKSKMSLITRFILSKGVYYRYLSNTFKIVFNAKCRLLYIFGSVSESKEVREVIMFFFILES